MNIKISIILCLILISNSTFTQIIKLKDSWHYKYRKTLSMYAQVGDLTAIKKNFLNNELAKIGIPESRWLNASIMGVRGHYMTDNLFTSFTFSLSSQEDTLRDNFKLDLSYITTELGLGTNLCVLKNGYISPYIGLKHTRMRKVIARYSENWSVENYLNSRDIDLKINQLSLSTGINFTFFYQERMSFGFYMAYLHPLRKNAWINTASGALQHNLGSPFKHFNLGIGYGMGLAQWY